MTTRHPTPQFKPGDRVAYTVQWLKSVGMSRSDLTHARGTIADIQPLGEDRAIATIVWDGLERNYPRKVLTDNLAHVGPNPRFSNVD